MRENSHAVTVLFVHGTGVRGEGYEQTLLQIRQGMAKEGLPFGLRGCPWGEVLGVKRPEGRSVPEYGAMLAPQAIPKEQQQIALWFLLYEDPLYELRVLALRDVRENDAGEAELAPGQVQPGPRELRGNVADLDGFIADPEQHFQRFIGKPHQRPG